MMKLCSIVRYGNDRTKLQTSGRHSYRDILGDWVPCFDWTGLFYQMVVIFTARYHYTLSLLHSILLVRMVCRKNYLISGVWFKDGIVGILLTCPIRNACS